ncbi:glycosyltransferase [Paenibacillus sp. GP183]|uniref:glycosyltransferase n=1 Tax=Paenibacillus sp. GP183 TaxID=1882751 RepID=UPI00089910DD|nr:glycosyltransferase [Paenibacillus sp. GP183]SEC69385.1 Glycosyltransferase involved in cell wall bisynthesis [Paenibacillus sp. GP183]
MDKILHYKYALISDHSTPHVKSVPGFDYVYMTDKKKPTDPQFRFLFKDVVHYPDIFDFPAFIRQQNVKAIHAHYGQLAMKLLPFKKSLGIPLITSFRGLDATSYIRNENNQKKLQKLYTNGELFLPVCHYLANRLIRSGCPEKKIQVLYGGVDVDLFHFRPRTKPSEGRIRILSVGRFVEKKGFRYLLEAFAKVNQSYPQTELKIIGRTGPVSEEVQNIIKRNRLQNVVIIENFIDHRQIVEEMHSAHLFCLPSVQSKNGDEEGIPNVLKEAMATGAPVVSTKHAGIPELITDGKEGILVKERNVGQLVTALEQMIQEPQNWVRWGKDARKRIEKNFNLNIQLSFQAALYKEVITKFQQRS